MVVVALRPLLLKALQFLLPCMQLLGEHFFTLRILNMQGSFLRALIASEFSPLLFELLLDRLQLGRGFLLALRQVRNLIGQLFFYC